MQRISLTIFLIFLMVSISQADQNDPKLKILFNDLSQTQSEMKAQPILLEIWSIWSVAIDTKTQEKFDAVKEAYKDNGILIIFIGAFTPLPYKVFTIASGLIGFNLLVFILISFISRGLRFFLVSYFSMKFGEKFGILLEKYGAI